MQAPPSRVPRRSDRLPSTDAVKEALQLNYGITGRIERLGGEATLNLRVRAHDTVHFVKVADAGAEGDATRREAAVLAYLSRATHAHVRVPVLMDDLEGCSTSVISNEDGHHFLLMVTSFLDGAAMDPDGREVVDEVERLGSAVADLTRSLSGLQLQSRAPVPVWSMIDADTLLAKLPVNVLSDAGASAQVPRIEHAVAGLLPKLAGLELQWIHHDVNPSNVLVPTHADSPMGVIDFGDSGIGPRIVDLGVAAAYLVNGTPGTPDPWQLVTRLVRGFHSVTPLHEHEVRLVPEVISLRLAMAIAITRVQAYEHPENLDYLLRNTQFAAARQELLDAYGMARLADELVKASVG